MARLFEYEERRVKERSKRSEGGRRYRSANPVTPIPRRASASSPGSVRVRARYSVSRADTAEDDITRLPTIPPSDRFVERENERYRPLHPEGIEEYADICEQRTQPPVLLRPYDKLVLRAESSYVDALVEADTLLDDLLNVAPALDRYPTRVEDVVDVALTERARDLLLQNRVLDKRPVFRRHPLDYARWWLLGPGHLEFVFWLGGAVLLSIVICVLLVMMGLGMGWLSFGHIGH